MFGSVDGEWDLECGKGEGSPVEIAGRDADLARVPIGRCCLAPATELLLHVFCGCLHGRGDLPNGPCLVEPATDILGRVLHGQGFRGEGLPGSLRVAGAVDTEDPPVGSAEVMGDEVQPLIQGDDVMRVDAPARRCTFGVGVVEGERFAIASRKGEGCQHIRVHGGGAAAGARQGGYPLQGVDPASDLGGEYLRKLGECADGCGRFCRVTSGCSVLQGDDDGVRFLFVEDQWG